MAVREAEALARAVIVDALLGDAGAVDMGDAEDGALLERGATEGDWGAEEMGGGEGADEVVGASKRMSRRTVGALAYTSFPY